MGKRGNAGQPWYHRGLQFTCTQCGSCCSGAPGYVWVDAQEIAAMAQALAMDEESFREKFVRRVGARESLIEYSDGDCIFLDPQTRGCMVYTARPVQCRTWPFWDSNIRTPSDWEKTCEVCPGAGEGKLYTLAQIDLARTRALAVDDEL
ncbi:MAG: YkgJ family cysteine cluster protein [Aureliella sp.]